MKSKERVLAAFEHQEPDRVPCWFGAMVEFWEKAKQQLNLDDEQLRVHVGDDFRRVFSEYAGPEFELSEEATYRTPFGVERHGMGFGQPMSHPLAKASVKEVHDYPWPGGDWIDVSKIRKEADKYQGEYAILGGEWSPFWHDLIDMLGMENMYIKMYTEPDLINAILQHLVDYYADASQRIFDAAGDVIDIFFIANDFGSQTGPLLGPDLFRRFMLPHIKRLADLGHSYGLKVQHHCCGGFLELIPLMIEAGIDGLHAIQPCCRGMDLARLKAEFGDKILFNGAIDSQHVLIDGNPESVREKTREVLEIMMPGGGYVAGASHDTILEETPLENVLSMFDAIKEFGSY
ncbi:MAG: uroporphyrinogen decarboxylase family protein [Planctomycetota bacterium]|jgi:uroporphyrinogen-III decarboxylase